MLHRIVPQHRALPYIIPNNPLAQLNTSLRCHAPPRIIRHHLHYPLLLHATMHNPHQPAPPSTVPHHPHNFTLLHTIPHHSAPLRTITHTQYHTALSDTTKNHAKLPHVIPQNHSTSPPPITLHNCTVYCTTFIILHNPAPPRGIAHHFTLTHTILDHSAHSRTTTPCRTTP